MKKKENRRTFLKTSALVGTGVFLGQSCSYAATAQEKQKDAPVNDTIKTIQNLRTIHGNFTDREIPDETINLILHSSIRAANASNTQSYSIVVVKDRALMRQVCTYQGSCMLLYCVDFNRLKAYAEHLGYAYFPDTVEKFVTSSINAAFAAQTAVIAARSLGVDCLTTNGIHRGDMERVWKLLDLPQTYCFPLIAVVLGYPTAEPKYRVGRVDGPGIIHHEKYHRMTKEEIEEQVQQYDDPERHLAVNNEGWKDQGYKHFMDWWFQKWLGGSKPAGKETQMLRLLKRSGFVELQKA
jgi:nitroreductase